MSILTSQPPCGVIVDVFVQESFRQRGGGVAASVPMEEEDAVSLALGTEVDHRSSFSAEKAPNTIKVTKTEKFSKNWKQQARQRGMNYENPRIIDVQNYSIFVATWNIVGRTPPSDLSLDEWLHSSAMPSDFSRSSDDDNGLGDSPSTVLYSPCSTANENGDRSQ
ncbi:unnamed protein product [Arabis nemorensis]|uniref:Inositol polyphosphate-related phosphatase domain-containing protein n=1 Tax=Arabis nemorensis TaxID=586526 RepID=A0A565BJG8_9BRAS|nr:unnamed protein product [Arabis nemorensis]